MKGERKMVNIGIRTTVAMFQRETHSNSVLDFITWIENRELLEKNEQRMKPSNADIAKKIVADLDKKKDEI